MRKKLMHLVPILAVAAILALPTTASAVVVGSLGGGAGTFQTLTAAGLTGTANLTGGTVYTSDQPFADIPAGGIFGGTFLGSGPSSGTPAGTPALLTFTAPITYFSFLWGSPDTYNGLTITSNQGVYNFNVSAGSLNFPVTNGDQSFSQYVQFQAGAGEVITSALFLSTTADAFEAANFNVVAAVPEPSTWAMMILGFAGVGFMAYRRKNPAKAASFRLA